MITSNRPSSSGSTQTSAPSHDQFSSFSNQPSSHYPMPPNLLPYNPFSPYFLPVQQPVLPPSYPQTYLTSSPYTLQQGNDPTRAHAPSDFPLPANPDHLNQQYSVLPSHTNTPILHQNPSFSYEQHPLPSLSSGPSQPQLDHHYLSSNLAHRYHQQPSCTNTAAILHQNLSSCPDLPPLLSSGPPPPQRPRLDSPHLTSFNPISTAVAHHSLAPPTPATTILSPQLNTTLTSQRVSNTTTSEHTQSDSTRHLSNAPYHTEQSLYQQSFPSHPRQSFTFNRDSTFTAYYPLAPPLPPATTPSGVTAFSSTPAHQHPLSPAMQRYVTYLKKVYMKKTTPVYDKEHSLLQVKAKSFINIALVHKDSTQYTNDSVRNEMIMDRLHGHVDAIQEMKTKLFICNVCKSHDGTLARSVLVEGAPGVGKTTFAYELCKRWAGGEILWEWAAVVLIKLRDHTTRTAQNMYDLLYHPRQEVLQAVIDELIDHDGECILLILDGYDELTDSQKKRTSVIQRLMSKELLVEATLVVTSRPLATRNLHDNFKQSIDQHIEVLGFTEKNIEEYIQSACGDKPELVEDFKSYLSSHPFSSALMFNPLQCAIVTDLYRSHWESGGKGFAPKTLTELYSGLVHIMLLRYLTQHPVYKDRYWRIKDLSDLPEEVSQQLKAVTELAAKGIRNQQYVFDEVNTNIPPETLGLMQKEEVVASGSGISTSHNFLHLTLQEYLAAVNYSQQYSSPEQLSQLLIRDDLFPLNNFLQCYGMKRKPSLYSSATHWPVVLFVAGRTKLRGVPTNILKTGLHDSDDDDDITTVEVSLTHLLYETQSPELIQSTLVTSRKYLSVSGSSALDWFVIGYCIANSTSTWRVEKKGNDSPKYFDQLVMGLRLLPEECRKHGECNKIGSLHITGHWTRNLKILSDLQPYTKLVTEMKLTVTNQKEQCNPEKRKSVSEEMSECYPLLEKFTIENVESSYSSTILSFISKHSNLHILSLNQCNLSSIATSSLIYLLQSPNNKLHKLTLYHCTIQTPYTSKSVVISHYQLKLTSFNDTGNFSLEITGSLYAINYMLSQPNLFYANTLTILKVTILSETIISLQTSLYPKLDTLEIVSKSEECTTCLHSFPFSSHENNLCIFSLMGCHLSSACVSTLINFLQSPNNRLHKLTLDDCTIQIPDHTNSVAISYYLTSATDTGNLSLEITGSLYAINYLLSQPHLFYLNTLSVLRVFIVSGTTDSLQTSLYPNLVTLEIVSRSEKNTVHLHIFPFCSHKNILRTFSLTRCHLSNECIHSLIGFLQSPNNRLRKLILDDCTIQIPDHTSSAAIFYYQLKVMSISNISLEITGSLYAINYMLSQYHQFYNKLAILEIVVVSETRDSLQIDTSLYPNLNILDISSREKNHTLLHDSVFHIISQQNNLISLSLKRCTLTCDIVRSLIHSLQSSHAHCRLQELTLDDCISDNTHSTTTSSKLQLKFLGGGNVSLEFTGYHCDISHWLKKLSPYTRLTTLILHLERQESTTADTFQEIQLYHYMLEFLKIRSFSLSIPIALPLSIPLFIGSQQNNLQTLSLCTCNLGSDVTRSLIDSLQSPHCKLYELALYDCTIPTTDRTQLTTAIVSNTTLTHLLFIDEGIDTPSLTALASGLKHNTTIEQLAVDKYCHDFTKDQFRLLIDAVDSSAVKKLWLYDSFDYKCWFSDYILDRHNVEWYNDYYNLYNKW